MYKNSLSAKKAELKVTHYAKFVVRLIDRWSDFIFEFILFEFV